VTDRQGVHAVFVAGPPRRWSLAGRGIAWAGHGFAYAGLLGLLGSWPLTAAALLLGGALLAFRVSSQARSHAYDLLGSASSAAPAPSWLDALNVGVSVLGSLVTGALAVAAHGLAGALVASWLGVGLLVAWLPVGRRLDRARTYLAHRLLLVVPGALALLFMAADGGGIGFNGVLRAAAQFAILAAVVWLLRWLLRPFSPALTRRKGLGQ
jgi:hypothetical protein